MHSYKLVTNNQKYILVVCPKCTILSVLNQYLCTVFNIKGHTICLIKIITLPTCLQPFKNMIGALL